MGIPLTRLLNLFTNRGSKSTRLQRRDRFRKYLFESLEPRNLLATYTVNSLLDGAINPADDATVFTLREATHQSSLSLGSDQILFAPALTANGPATITLTGGMMALSDVTIVGPGAHLLTVNGNANGRIFRVDSAYSASIDGLTLRNGSADRGGAIENLGRLAIANSAFESNAATLLDGGAIYNSGTLQVTGSTFSGNTAFQSAGAIGVYSGGNATIVNSTISGNAARLFGGAIDVNGSTATIISSTIVLNQAQSLNGGTGNGGGISSFGTVTLHNTIVAGNTMLSTNVTNDLANTTVQSTSSNNVIGDAATSGGLVHNTNGNFVGFGGSGTVPLSRIINTNLANNGGNTLTHALQPGSPATDGGNNSQASVPIPRLFPTGVGAASGSPDPHFQLFSAPPGAGSTALVINRNGVWVANTGDAKWIGLNDSGFTNHPVGEYVYRITFDLTGLDPTNATLFGIGSADDSAVIRLNGNATGQTFQAFNVLSAFSISTGFVAGINTLDFVVTNGGAGPNPTGLLVNSLSGTARLQTDQRGAGSPRIRGSSIDIGAIEAGRTIIDLSNLGPAGTTIFGADASDQSGFSVSNAGDVNGDGFDDFVIGARFADASGNAKPAAGDSYVIFGAASLPATIDLANLGSAGVTIFGADAFDGSGFSVSSAGDVNGDGFDDLLIGAVLAGASENAKSYAGDSYVIFGAASLPATIDLNTLGSAGITIFGAEADDRSGFSVSSAGDVNGDGFDDFVIGARYADASGNAKSDAGDSYVIFGAASLPATIDLSTLGSAGITIFGAEARDYSGFSVSSAGDVNGDGFDDFVIGARLADASGNAKSSAGDSYVIFGAASLPATIDLAALGQPGGPAGFTIFGADGNDSSGGSVSSAGDVNGDGFDDLLIGAYYADASGNLKSLAGDSYVIFGAASLQATIDLAALGQPGGPAGFTIFGADVDDFSGISVSSAGDVNGDGFDDLLIGAYEADASGNAKSKAGDSYVLIGGNGFTNSILPAYLGASGASSLLGDASANRINGAGGNDIVSGGGGADVLLGGQGNDIFIINDASFQRIVGGTGRDSLWLNNPTNVGFTLNLTTIPDNRLQGIEEIDITGSGNNTLTLSYREVLNLSSQSNTLVVRRNIGDVVNIGTGWTPVANELIQGVGFNVYKQGAAVLKVQAISSVVLNRQVFYNRSTNVSFGNGTGNPINAIDATRVALLPGQASTSANVTNYIHGINGILIDANVPTSVTVADLAFATWNGIAAGGFVATAATPTLTVIANGGVGGSTRLKIEFNNGAVVNTWLRVTLKGNVSTGLAADDVFYFGNAAGEVDRNMSDVRVSASDLEKLRRSISIRDVAISSIFDIDKDGRVSVFDYAALRQRIRAQVVLRRIVV